MAVLCSVLQVSAAGCYVRRTSWFDAWRSRPEGKRAAENRALLDDIRQVHVAQAPSNIPTGASNAPAATARRR